MKECENNGPMRPISVSKTFVVPFIRDFGIDYTDQVTWLLNGTLINVTRTRLKKYLPTGAHPLLLLETPLPPNSNSQLTVCFKLFHLSHSNSQLIQRLWSWFGMFCGSNMLSAYPGRFFMTQLGRNSMV